MKEFILTLRDETGCELHDCTTAFGHFGVHHEACAAWLKAKDTIILDENGKPIDKVLMIKRQYKLDRR